MPGENDLNDFIKNQEIPHTTKQGYLVYGNTSKVPPRQWLKMGGTGYLIVLALMLLGLAFAARNLKEVLLFLASFALVFSAIFYIIKKATKSNKPK